MTTDDDIDVQAPKMRKVGKRPPLHRYLSSTWRSRQFVSRLGVADPIVDAGPSVLQRLS